MSRRNTVIALIKVTSWKNWTLWRFTVAPRSHRYCWVLKGHFPTYLFDADVILHGLDRTEERALEEMHILKESGQFDGE